MTDAVLETTCAHFVRAFGAVAFAMSDDETRLPYYAVNVTADSMRTMLEATNGHVFARWTICEGIEQKDFDRSGTEPGSRWIQGGRGAQFMIPAPAVRKAISAARRWGGPIVDVFEGEIGIPGMMAATGSITWDPPMYSESTIGGKVFPAKRVEFPYSLRLWPDPNRAPEQEVPLSTEYMVKVAQAFKHAYERPKKKHKRESAAPTWPTIEMNYGAALDPIVFRSHDVPALTFLVMPCRK